MRKLIRHRRRKRARVPGKKKGNNSVAKRIIRYRVQRAAVKIALTLSVSDLPGGILPNLADHLGAGIAAFYRPDDPLGKSIVVFVHDVESEASDSHLHVMGYDTVADKAPERIVLYGFGQIAAAPPAIVFIRKARKGKPITVRRRRIRDRVTEIKAFISDVIEHSVENYTDTVLFCLVSQQTQRGIPAEPFVHP